MTQYLSLGRYEINGGYDMFIIITSLIITVGSLFLRDFIMMTVTSLLLGKLEDQRKIGNWKKL